MPDDVIVRVEPGMTVMAVAQKAGVSLTNICGGGGICGKCKVIVDVGILEIKPTSMLTPEEVKQNYVLACETIVRGPAQISIPEETRPQKGRILIDEEAHRFGVLPRRAADQTPLRHDVLVRKVHVAMAEPTMEDGTADHDRLHDAIATATGEDVRTMQTGFRLLKSLPRQLRDWRWEVTATLAHRGATLELADIEPGDESNSNYGVVVDVGTTTVVAHLVHLPSARTVDAEATYNSQMSYGEDYIARIIHSVRNSALAEMSRLIVDDVNELISVLAERNAIGLGDVTCVVCAGNTPMIHFLLGLAPGSIRSQPYVPSISAVPPIRAGEAGVKINPRGMLYCLPSVVAFVGSDITAGVAAIGLHEADKLSLLIDIGTNGEVVLGNREWMMCCSASAGPAFEGSGVRHGMRAAHGAIERMRISASLEVTYDTVGDTRPRGLCGSGLLDCVAEMFRAGVIDRTGRIQSDLDTDRVRQDSEGLQFVIEWAENTDLQTDLVITQADIENLIRSKAAIYAAVSVLVESIGLSIGGIETLYLAGGFGSYLDVGSAIAVGMLPDLPHERVQFVGNTCIAGAKMALLSHEMYERIRDIAASMSYMDMMSNPKYMDEFVQALFLPHTNLDEFPSAAPGMAGARMEAISPGR